MNDEYWDENLYELANAIVMQACKEYKSAVKRHDEYECKNLEHFFLSEYFMDLTRDKLSGSGLIKELRKQVGADSRVIKRRRARLINED